MARPKMLLIVLCGDLAALVAAILLETGLPAGRLEIEITEGVLIGDFLRASRSCAVSNPWESASPWTTLAPATRLFSYLQAFPFDRIKIDQAFVANLDRPQSAAIVRAVIGLCKGLEIPMVAEGVETKGQLAFCRKNVATRCKAISSAVRHPLPAIPGLSAASERRRLLLLLSQSNARCSASRPGRSVA